MLVHVGDGVYDEQTMATAVKLAARRRRGIHVLVTIIVPRALPIDAPLSDAESAADTIIEQAKLPGWRARLRALEKVARRPGGPPDHRGGAGHARDRGRDGPASSASRARPCSARRSRPCSPSGPAA